MPSLHTKDVHRGLWKETEKYKNYTSKENHIFHYTTSTM